jgi:hypothetical protein
MGIGRRGPSNCTDKLHGAFDPGTGFLESIDFTADLRRIPRPVKEGIQKLGMAFEPLEKTNIRHKP